MTAIQSISITSFEHPHRFWYIKSHLKHEEFIEFDGRFQKYIGNKIGNTSTKSEYVLCEDAIVAIYDQVIKKWIRVIIKEILSGNIFKLWAIDYGFHLKCQDLADLIELPNDLCKPSFNRILLGGIYGVVPNENVSKFLFKFYVVVSWTKCNNFYLRAHWRQIPHVVIGLQKRLRRSWQFYAMPKVFYSKQE